MKHSNSRRLLRKWKYNTKLLEHWFDAEETGSLQSNTKCTKTEENETEEIRDKDFKLRKLKHLPSRLGSGEEGEPGEDGIAGSTAPAEVEREDRFHCNFAASPQDPYQNLAASMEALLAKSAKMDDLASKVAKSEHEDAPRPLLFSTQRVRMSGRSRL